MTDRIDTMFTPMDRKQPTIISFRHRWGSFVCDICGLPGEKTTKIQRSHQGACRAEHRRQYEKKIAAKAKAKKLRRSNNDGSTRESLPATIRRADSLE
jgi:hypothetical protein